MNRLRVILDGAHPGRVNMDRDSALLSGHAAGEDPVLRLYLWDPPSVTIGHNQDLSSFAASAITEAGYDLVRRPTGGRAILHAQELTYCLVGSSPGPVFGDSLHQVYMTINRGLLGWLEGLGLAGEISSGESRAEARGIACFKSAGRHEISCGGRKLIGSAQRRTRGVFLQHGSILAGPAHRELAAFLVGREQAADEVRDSLAESTTDLSELLGKALGPEELETMFLPLAEAMAVGLGLEPHFEEWPG